MNKPKTTCKFFNRIKVEYAKLIVKMGSTTRAIIKFTVPNLFPMEYVVTAVLSEEAEQNDTQQHWIHELTTINIVSKDHVDGCMIPLYSDEIEYSYE